jgi:hypothetical protein
MLGVFAEFETNLRRERQLEGIAEAKAAGVYKERKPTISSAEVRKLKDDGLGATEIAKHLGIERASVYRAPVGLGLVFAGPKVAFCCHGNPAHERTAPRSELNIGTTEQAEETPHGTAPKASRRASCSSAEMPTIGEREPRSFRKGSADRIGIRL